MPIYPENLTPAVRKALQATIDDIHESYVNGNKCTARTLFGAIADQRKAYAAVLLMQKGDEANTQDDMLRLICSITT